ncbi:hypothetical protein GCM10010329_48180 [Streptomyces spiroverticillatus]|uniref:Uncharacterized protein n=1 Tax=Streptomyces finlayi TaxID=67296 RepID=A0A918X1D5_9ACTN|nr:hypothetical protein [Streptomyces finlayi]GHA19552.1 hypothetical protein GCM10010329_48180 [Streptomyces spiroverticillatus]GHD02496.1 hypothetical protein GCM10010334_49130 [Streptomyces finlayi]
MNTSDHAVPAAGLPEPASRPRPGLVFDDPLDQQSSDDTDRGWGDRPTTSGGTADLARFLDEKPPHHV